MGVWIFSGIFPCTSIWAHLESKVHVNPGLAYWVLETKIHFVVTSPKQLLAETITVILLKVMKKLNPSELEFLEDFFLSLQADKVLPQERNTDWIWEWSSRVEVQPQK